MTPRELRQRVANVASAEIDCSDAVRYWREALAPGTPRPYPPHWCGAFTLWALRVALGCQWHWEIGKGYLWRLKPTRDPDLGDVCYMDRPFQHHAILTAIGDTADGRAFAISVDGNAGAPPTHVDEVWRAREKWTVFYSIQPLIDTCNELS